ncbi:MAG TPA: DUF2381 family protein [Myxococcaceae bacterium]|nr:DUF2381 family protein [Myxococcaceae bacterium]
MPSSFSRVAAGALLACSTIASATPPPVARVRREQQLVLSEPAPGLAPELRLAPGVTTVLQFDLEIEPSRVEIEGLGHLLWADVGRHSIVLRLLRPLPPGKRLRLTVPFKDGRTTPSQASFLLVSRPGEVDSVVVIERHPRAPESPMAQEAASPQREDDPLLRLVYSGEIAEQGVTARPLQGATAGEQVRATEAWEYLTPRRRLIAFHVRNPPGARPWSPAEVVPLSASGLALPADERLRAFLDGPAIAPGEKALVVVEVPLEYGDGPLHLEVRERGGNRHVKIQEKR